MIRVVIADDSAFMRKILSDLFGQQSDFQVVGMAADGREAVNQVAKLKPDLLTLDVNMPVMDGLKALEIIMQDCPIPVIMFSSLTKKGADETIKALSLGAVDFQTKAGGSISRLEPIADEFLAKCRAAAKAKIRKTSFYSNNSNNIIEKKQEAADLKRINILDRSGTTSRAASILGGRSRNTVLDKTAPEIKKPEPVTNKFGRTNVTDKIKLAQRVSPFSKPTASSASGSSSSSMGSGRGSGVKLVALGTSTGGPRALQAVIPLLPADLPCGVVVVQHMPAGFTKSLAERLNTLSKVTVKEAEDHDIIKPGHVYIAPGNYHMTIKGNGSSREIALNQDPPLASHRPAVDIMFDSVVQYGRDVVSVILTGMGCDGAAGMKKIKQSGGYIIAESSETCVVYGMPKAVVEAGIADEVVPVQQVAGAIVKAVRK